MKGNEKSWYSRTSGKNLVLLACIILLFGAGSVVWAQEAAKTTDIPIRRIALFSSGVGYFEHRGNVSGLASTVLVFDADAVNDVLKSLVISDPEATNPSVTYPSEETLYRTLKSLKIDLSASPGIAEILAGMKGAELQVYTPSLVSGRIIGVETRTSDAGNGTIRAISFLSLFTKDGIKAISLDDISSFSFTDPKVGEDLNRALDLILQARDSDTRNLQVNLPGKAIRAVTLGYVVPSPVWKVSYRLDLSGEKPVLQGWAIIDNDSDMDWKEVELSLVTGRPVSFIQNLYAPYHVARPELPLAIAGVAQAQTYDSGFGLAKAESVEFDYYAESEMPSAAPMAQKAMRAEESQGASYAGVSLGLVETASARAAGDQFEFTVKRPVTLARQQSAMIPLVEASVSAEKISVFSGTRASGGGVIHPMLCAELSNSTGMKLPAGPITVFDGGIYAGDALIEFFPENEKRIIAFGEDLSVTGSMVSSSTQTVTSVIVSRGVMTFSRQNTYEKKYTLKNASNRDRLIVVEHPVTYGAKLTAPEKFREKTDALYRFNLPLAAGKETTFEVKEQSPSSDSITLSSLRFETLVSYSSNREVPAKVKAALEKAIEFRRTWDEKQTALSLAETQRKDKISEQDRIRLNLQAAGNESQQGKEYLKRLALADTEIEALTAKVESARKAVQDAKAAFETYLANLSVD